jgi:transposase
VSVPRAGPKKIQQYSRDFKLTAVRLSQQPGMQVQVVAAALDIHPFMLSRWRKAVRDGVLRGRPPRAARIPPAREMARLQRLERAHALLQEEHTLLKKAIRFCSERRPMRSRSSTPSGTRTP